MKVLKILFKSLQVSFILLAGVIFLGGLYIYDLLFAGRNDLGCFTRMSRQSISLFSSPYAKSEFEIPKAYLDDRHIRGHHSKPRPEFIRLNILLKDMSPACLSNEYKNYQNRQTNEPFASVAIRPNTPQGFKRNFERYRQREYPIFIKEDKNGFDLYRSENEVLFKNTRGSYELLLPPQGFFKDPGYMTCWKQETGERTLCRVNRLYNEYFEVEYAIRHTQLPNLAAIDENIRSLINGFLKKQTPFGDKQLVSFDQKECEGTVLVNISGVKLNVPRNADIYSTDNKLLMDMDSPRYNCALTQVDAQSVDYGIFNQESLTFEKTPLVNPERGKDHDSKTTYKVFGWDGKAFNNAKIGPDNTKVLLLQYYDRYLLPQTEMSRGNSEPVLVDCDPLQPNQTAYTIERCRARYVHPNGLFVRHSYRRRDMGDNSILQMEQAPLRLITEMTIP